MPAGAGPACLAAWTDRQGQGQPGFCPLPACHALYLPFKSATCPACRLCPHHATSFPRWEGRFPGRKKISMPTCHACKTPFAPIVLPCLPHLACQDRLIWDRRTGWKCVSCLPCLHMPPPHTPPPHFLALPLPPGIPPPHTLPPTTTTPACMLLCLGPPPATIPSLFPHPHPFCFPPFPTLPQPSPTHPSLLPAYPTCLPAPLLPGQTACLCWTYPSPLCLVPRDPFSALGLPAGFCPYSGSFTCLPALSPCLPVQFSLFWDWKKLKHLPPCLWFPCCWEKEKTKVLLPVPHHGFCIHGLEIQIME